MIEASGGYPRDLIRLLRQTLVRAVGALPATSQAVDDAIRDLEQDYALVFRTQDLELLAEVARTHDVPRLDDCQVRRIHHLVANMVVLCYRNGRPWYDLHPMLKRHPKIVERLARDRTVSL